MGKQDKLKDTGERWQESGIRQSSALEKESLPLVAWSKPQKLTMTLEFDSPKPEVSR